MRVDDHPRSGTSGWNYPTGRGTWNGVFYPARRPRGFDELAYYAEHFDTVEVNSTFYRMPEARMSAPTGCARTPLVFQFSVKLYQKFTHPDMYPGARGRRATGRDAGDLDEFRHGIEPIAEAGRLAAVLAAVSVELSRRAGDARLPRLAARRRSRAYPLAVELRHRSWSDESSRHATRCSPRIDAAWVHIDEPKFAGLDRAGPLGRRRSRSTAPLSTCGSTAGTRRNWWKHESAEDRYDYLYTPEELRPFADAARSVHRQPAAAC